jgi:hypothetical protein
MESDGADRQQGQTDRCSDSDRRPHQTDEHSGDASEFAHADEPPLQWLDTEVIADCHGLGDTEQLDAR